MLVADYAVTELAHLPKHIKAENGGAGRGENCKGRNGSDQIFEVKKKKSRRKLTECDTGMVLHGINYC